MRLEVFRDAEELVRPEPLVVEDTLCKARERMCHKKASPGPLETREECRLDSLQAEDYKERHRTTA